MPLIGQLIALLLIGRLLYRAVEFYLPGAAQMPSFGRSPLTLAIFGTMALYYVMYGIGLLRWRKTERTLEVM